MIAVLIWTAAGGAASGIETGSATMIDIDQTVKRLEMHLRELTIAIGERSLRQPAKLAQTAAYLQSFYAQIGLEAHRQSYRYGDLTVANVIAELPAGDTNSPHYLVGAHYDSVAGTVGADDNASAIAVQLETARHLKRLRGQGAIDCAVTFVSFALEEPPAYATRFMGSRVYARQARSQGLTIDGMICLEMVGYTCRRQGCQNYPFPLSFMGYPKTGDFIGIVGNFGSGRFMRRLFKAFETNPQLPVVKLTVPFNGWLLPSVRLSDHASFWDQGYPAVMVTDSAFYRNPHYHMASDTMEKLDFSFMAELVQSLILFFQTRH